MNIDKKITDDLVANDVSFVTTVPCKQLAGVIDEIDAREEPRFGVGSERRRRATSVGRDRAMKRATKRRRDSRVR